MNQVHQKPIPPLIEIVQVVAYAKPNRVIGKDNQLLWHISADLQHFKALTSGQVILMGRKTFESLGRVLPNREHVVLTRDINWQYDHHNVHVAYDLLSLIETGKQLAIQQGLSSVFVIGGGELYRQTLQISDRLELTEVDIVIEGDAFYPELTNDFVVSEQSEILMDDQSGISYQFIQMKKCVGNID